MEVLGVSLDPTVDLGRVDYNFKMFKDGDRWHGHSWRHRLVDGTRFFVPILSDVLPLESLDRSPLPSSLATPCLI